MEAKKRKEKLLANKRAGNAAAAQAANTASPATSSGARNNNHAPPRGAGEESGGSDRTTRMLLAVLLLFLITEFPQGLLALLSGLLGDNFFKSCYIPIADLMDFIALLNSAINFILYCSMSKKFRDTFSKVFGLDEVAKRTTEWRLRRRRRREELNNHNHINSPNCVNRSLLGNQEQTAVWLSYLVKMCLTSPSPQKLPFIFYLIRPRLFKPAIVFQCVQKYMWQVKVCVCPLSLFWEKLWPVMTSPPHFLSRWLQEKYKRLPFRLVNTEEKKRCHRHYKKKLLH